MWGMKLTDACDNFTNPCWKNAMANRKDVHDRIHATSKPELKPEFKTIAKTSCYLHVCKVAEKDLLAELKNIVNWFWVDTTHLNNV